MALVTMRAVSMLDRQLTIDLQWDNAGNPPWPVQSVIVQNLTPYYADFVVTRYRANGSIQNQNSYTIQPNTPTGTTYTVPGNRYFVEPDADDPANLAWNFSINFSGLRASP